MSAGTTSQVTTGKRGIDGGIYVAPIGTTLPTTATETLNSAFKNLGYVSEDGVTNTLSRSTTDIKEWGGDVIDTVVTEQGDAFKTKFMEALNVDLLKQIFGASNVTESSGAITVKVQNANLTPAIYVIDMAQKGGRLKRIVIPNGKLAEVGDIVYKGTEAVAYDVTIKAALDSAGYTHYEYISAAGT